MPAIIWEKRYGMLRRRISWLKIYISQELYIIKDNFKENWTDGYYVQKDHLHTLFNDLSTVDIPKIAVIVSSETNLLQAEIKNIDYIF